MEELTPTITVEDSEARMADVAVALRESAATRDAAPPFGAVRGVVEYLSGRTGALERTPAQMAEEYRITPEAVCDIVAGLGTFLGQSRRRSAGRAVAHSKSPFPTAADYEVRTGTSWVQPASGKKTKVSDEQLLMFVPMHTADVTILPPGWERSATGRELDRAVANIVDADPDDEMLQRWMLRQWGNAAVSVSFELVSMLWMLARLRRVHEVGRLAELGSGNPSLARALADAWDILEVSRTDAVAAIDHLTVSPGTPSEVLADIARCRWVCESELNRVESVATRALNGEPGQDQHLTEELELFASTVAANPDRIRPNRVAALNVGQVRRLCEAAGLDPEGDGPLRRQVSSLVSEAGLAADSDRLIGLGVAALRADEGELFAASLERRSSGALDWADELHTALGITS